MNPTWFDGILYPLKWVVAWIMYGAHAGLTALGLRSDAGITWVLSIVFLVVVIRILLIPLFVRQIKASRGMQLVQPEIQKLQKKYKGKTDPASRQAMQQEMMQIYRDNGTSPFASCLPILAQMPIFFALFRVLSSLQSLADGTYPGRDSIGPITQQVAQEAESSSIFGARLSDTFLGSDLIQVKVICAVLVVIMSATTLFTQRQLTMKNMPQSALDNPLAKQQRILMYIFPLVFMVSGVSFPIGVLLYWTTSNVWTLGQQWWVIRNNPTPGSEAEREYLERKARKAARKQGTLEDETADGAGSSLEDEPTKPENRQRQQPRKGGSRSQRARRQGAVASNEPGSAHFVSDEPIIEDAVETPAEPAASAESTKPAANKSKKKSKKSKK